MAELADNEERTENFARRISEKITTGGPITVEMGKDVQAAILMG